jgi:hypothetical protein
MDVNKGASQGIVATMINATVTASILSDGVANMNGGYGQRTQRDRHLNSSNLSHARHTHNTTNPIEAALRSCDAVKCLLASIQRQLFT